MTTTTTQPQSRIKDLVVTATVASIVTAIVGPMIRRWIEGGPSQPSDDFDDLDEPPPTSPDDAVLFDDDDYEVRAQRLFEFEPEAIPVGTAVMFNPPPDSEEP